jgi:hypothetical protein
MENPMELSNQGTHHLHAGEVEVVIDLENYAKERRKPPATTLGYRVKINGEPFVICKAHISGREILTVGGFLPPDNFTLRLKIHGEKPRKVSLDEIVDLTEIGVEKFVALPRDQTEGGK